MDRNVESHFSQLPQAEIQRSIMSRNSEHITTFNVGSLIPVYVDEVLPGDTWRMTTSKVVRLQTLLAPIFDQLFLDTYWFFIPNRLMWQHWEEFCGENKSTAWTPSTTYSIPKIASPEGGWNTGTIADYLGIPVGVETQTDPANPDYRHFPMSLPFRGYGLICNEFFRDENLTDPVLVPTGDALQQGLNGTESDTSYIHWTSNGGPPFKVAKYHDYFTSALPDSQKGSPISIPLPEFPGGDYAITPRAEDYYNPDLATETPWPLRFGAGTKTSSGWTPYVSGSAGWYEKIKQTQGTDYSVTARGTTDSSSFVNDDHYIWPSNLAVTLPTVSASNISINAIRLAFAAQRMLEKNARGGTRYIEILKSHFGVTSPDARLQRPEYLGGNRIPLQVSQVTSTAQTSSLPGSSGTLGNVGAMSYTADLHADFEKSFTEHGLLMCVCCVRYDHTYAQGLEKFWLRNDFTDFYLPVFANIGEQPILKSEIFYDGTKPDVFGFQEAWSEYRYKPNRVSSSMRPVTHGTAQQSLASWHLADDYAEAPTLSDSWIREDENTVNRVLAVSSSISDQVLADFHFSGKVTRPMPMYSVPGLLDHN